MQMALINEKIAHERCRQSFYGKYNHTQNCLEILPLVTLHYGTHTLRVMSF